MQQQITTLHDACLQEIQQARTTQELEAIHVRYFGKKGPLQALMKDLRSVSAEERPAAGKAINDLRDALEQVHAQAAERLRQQELERQLSQESLDITLPGRRPLPGCRHVTHAVMDQLVDVLVEMGFSVQDGPEIETDYYNFEALNFAKDHPARDMQDTFYVAPDVVLRTHTSNVQMHVMEAHRPPIRIIAPGRVYRNEAVSSRSHVFFHQLEGVYVDKNVTFADLMSTLEEFLTKVFQQQIVARFRPAYFPFVEPGVEVDIRCSLCSGVGCPLCKHTGWLEVLGAGLIHPEVLKNGGIDPEEYSGFAWGLGIERIAVIKYGIDDIRLFSENDLRFLHQFQTL